MRLASEISGELDVDAVTVKVEPSISLAIRPHGCPWGALKTRVHDGH